MESPHPNVERQWFALADRLAMNVAAATICWQALVDRYTQPHRHYHTLDHLAYMLGHAERLREQITDASAFWLAIFYHDAIYDPKRKDNEAESARWAMGQLSAFTLSDSLLQRVVDQILATQAHQPNPDADTSLLLDIDLGILGESRERYTAYTQQVRKEYSIYPTPIYRKGRKQVLQHFLDMPTIYNTPSFQASHEAPARANLAWELGTL